MDSKEIKSGVLTTLAKQMRLSATLEINELVHQQTAKGFKVVHLGFGEATFPIQKDVAAAHREASNITSYLPVAGLAELREVGIPISYMSATFHTDLRGQAIAKFQSRRLKNDIRAGQVVVAPGSKPLLFALFDLLQGDVLLPRPSWVSYEPQIIHAGKQIFWVETDEDDRHTITGLRILVHYFSDHSLIACIEKSLQSAFSRAIEQGGNPRIMLINSPSNPTGHAFDESDIEIISTFCKSHDITLISDEIYSDISFSEQSSATPCSGSQFNLSQKILTGGLSKVYISLYNAIR